MDEILNCYEELAKFDGLKPSSNVDNAFGRLVGLCSQCPGEEIVAKVCHARERRGFEHNS